MLRQIVLASFAVSAFAQSEAALKSAFEGKRVVVKIEMPATKWGIDLWPGATPPIDFKAYSHRIKEHGTALRAGDSVMITGIKLKENHIEFQLGGGGYGTLFDETDSDVYVPVSGKSHRERDLERAVKNETDPEKRKKLKRELSDVRADRARDDRVAEAVAESASETRRMRIEQKALQAGSRFNLRYPKGHLRENVPTPEMVMAALAEYVEF